MLSRKAQLPSSLPQLSWLAEAPYRCPDERWVKHVSVWSSALPRLQHPRETSCSRASPGSWLAPCQWQPGNTSPLARSLTPRELIREARLLDDPEFEEEELAQIYVERGVEVDLARKVAVQLMAKDSLGAHARAELGISEITTARPVQAALTSAATFSVVQLRLSLLFYYHHLTY
jgi:VIT family